MASTFTWAFGQRPPVRMYTVSTSPSPIIIVAKKRGSIASCILGLLFLVVIVVCFVDFLPALPSSCNFLVEQTPSVVPVDGRLDAAIVETAVVNIQEQVLQPQSVSLGSRILNFFTTYARAILVFLMSAFFVVTCFIINPGVSYWGFSLFSDTCLITTPISCGYYSEYSGNVVDQTSSDFNVKQDNKEIEV